jgi:cell division septal protein FtsQ
MSDFAARLKAGGAGSPRLRGREAELRAARGLVGLLVAGALLALAAAAVLLVPSALLVTRYEVSGNSALSREELLSAALIHEKEYFFSLDALRVKAALEAEPRVAEASVAKLFPNGLKIAVRERKAVAAALATIGGRTAAVCIDSEGVAYAEASAEEAASVPVLSGLRFEGFRPGTRLPSVVAALVASLGAIQAAEPALLASISEIRMVKANGGSSEILIYPLNQRIPVRAGASLDASTLRSIILVLDVLGTKGIAASVQEIDFRTGTVVYRSKEGQSG